MTLNFKPKLVAQPSLLLVVCDTLRADALDLYGGPASTEPLRRAAERLGGSLAWYRGVSNSFWTLPSHYTLFTGLLPSRHGVHEPQDLVEFSTARYYGERAWSYQGPMLAFKLRQKGYYAVGYSNNAGFVSHAFGLHRGFNEFVANPWSLMMLGGFLSPVMVRELEALAERFGGSRLRAALSVLRERGLRELLRLSWAWAGLKLHELIHSAVIDKGSYFTLELVKVNVQALRDPFMLFVNLMESHEPYYMGWPRPQPEEDPATYHLRLAGRVAGRLWRSYVRASERLVAIITSDHGQEFGEHGHLGHVTGHLFPENVEVPMIVYDSGGGPRGQRSAWLDLVDVHNLALTVADGGKALPPDADRPLIAESYGPFLPFRGLPEGELRELKVVRRAIYYGNSRAVINLTRNAVEEAAVDGRVTKDGPKALRVAKDLASVAGVQFP